ncbi:MAG: DUF2058 domain-containing protein [Thiomicrospira sp.]
MASLLDQMKKAGLVSEHKAKQAKKQKYQQSKQAKQQTDNTLSDVAKLAAQAAEQKAEKDRQLNRQRQQHQVEKAKQAELKQILESNRLAGFEGDIGFNFVDDRQVKTLSVNAKTQAGLVRGDIRIARLGEGYVLISDAAAQKIATRDASVLIAQPQAEDGLTDDERDYYAKFAIPDDWVW